MFQRGSGITDILMPGQEDIVDVSKPFEVGVKKR
jgi:hypothetical protein